MPITAELRRITEDRVTLTLDQASALMRRLLAGDASELELAALLGALAARGETAAEIAGFALAMREAATPLPLTELERAALVDTCGTGGDGSGTFNISTAAALVAAAAGAKVAKHGNRAVTSRCGSADVLEALGIPVDLSPEAAVEALRRHNFCFLLAPSHHPAMRALLPVRRALGLRTVFNTLGPLLNPAGARRQVIGVYAAHLVPVVAEALQSLGSVHAIVVHGSSDASSGFSDEGHESRGMDEFSLAGTSTAAEVRMGQDVPRMFSVQPEQLGLQRAALSTLQGSDAQRNAAMIERLFGINGNPETGPARDVVLLNAAAVLVVSARVSDLNEGARQAAAAIDSGAAAELLRKLRPG